MQIFSILVAAEQDDHEAILTMLSGLSEYVIPYSTFCFTDEEVAGNTLTERSFDVVVQTASFSDELSHYAKIKHRDIITIGIAEDPADVFTEDYFTLLLTTPLNRERNARDLARCLGIDVE